MMKKIFFLTMFPVLLLAGMILMSATQPVIQDTRSSLQDGKYFIASRSYIGSTQHFYMTVGAKKPRIRMSISAATESDTAATQGYGGLVTWYESAGALTTTGTLMTIYNMDRNVASTAATLKVSHTPGAISVTTSMTTMPTFYFNYGKFHKKQWNAFGPIEDDGWILKKSTTYLFQISNSSSIYSTHIKWYWTEIP